MAGYKTEGDESPNEGWKRGRNPKARGGKQRRRKQSMSMTSKNGIKKNHR